MIWYLLPTSYSLVRESIKFQDFILVFLYRKVSIEV
jgi:hypothetical protein